MMTEYFLILDIVKGLRKCDVFVFLCKFFFKWLVYRNLKGKYHVEVSVNLFGTGSMWIKKI